MKYYVLIRDYDTDEVVEKIVCKSEKQADKVEDGVNINLDHDEYYTEIVGE